MANAMDGSLRWGLISSMYVEYIYARVSPYFNIRTRHGYIDRQKLRFIVPADSRKMLRLYSVITLEKASEK